MRRWHFAPHATGLWAAVGLAVVSVGAAQAKETAVPGRALTCQSPVGPHDAAKTLQIRLGGDARIEDVAGAEGQTTKALVLHPKDSKRRLEVLYYDDAMTLVSEVRLGGQRGSAWKIAGLRRGDSLAQAVKANGRAFELSGFGWDYGGYVTDLRGGALATLKGGCIVGLRFAPPPNVGSAPDNVSGDRKLGSDDPALVKLEPVISELSLRWPRP